MNLQAMNQLSTSTIVEEKSDADESTKPQPEEPQPDAPQPEVPQTDAKITTDNKAAFDIWNGEFLIGLCMELLTNWETKNM